MRLTLLLSFLLASSLAHATTIFSFGFDSNLQGWTGATSGTPLNPVWQSTGGNPGGYYTLYGNTFLEGSNYGVLQASTAVSTFDSNVLDNTLYFDVRASNPFNISDYRLTATWSGFDSYTGQFSSSAQVSIKPTTMWQTIALPMNSFTCDRSAMFPCASWSEISNLSIDLIYGGVAGNAPASVRLDLDNVDLTRSNPEPTTAALNLLGLASVVFVVLLRRRYSAAAGWSFPIKPY